MVKFRFYPRIWCIFCLGPLLLEISKISEFYGFAPPSPFTLSLPKFLKFWEFQKIGMREKPKDEALERSYARDHAQLP